MSLNTGDQGYNNGKKNGKKGTLCGPNSLGTQLAHSSSYHPQSIGKKEIVNKCMEGYLRCFVSDKQT